jgi:hypothetical protein
LGITFLAKTLFMIILPPRGRFSGPSFSSDLIALLSSFRRHGISGLAKIVISSHIDVSASL